MMAFSRFVSRRGLPSIMYSDNALTFVSARNKLLSLYGPQSPKWKFIVPRSPWWGGFWERMVGSVKLSLKKTLGQRALTVVELNTLLVEVEACVNSRPLTFVSDDSQCAQPLSPAHFLLNRRHLYQPVVQDVSDMNRKQLLELENSRVELLNQFWSVWRQSYLRNLPVTVHKFYQKGDLCVGSVVIIREDNVPRLKWPMAIVEKLYRSHDGIARSALLKTSNGSKTRAIHRLHSLEIVDDTVLSQGDDENDDVNLNQVDVQFDASSDRNVPNVDYQFTRAGRKVKPVNRLDL